MLLLIRESFWQLTQRKVLVPHVKADPPPPPLLLMRTHPAANTNTESYSWVCVYVRKWHRVCGLQSRSVSSSLSVIPLLRPRLSIYTAGCVICHIFLTPPFQSHPSFLLCLIQNNAKSVTLQCRMITVAVKQPRLSFCKLPRMGVIMRKTSPLAFGFISATLDWVLHGENLRDEKREVSDDSGEVTCRYSEREEQVLCRAAFHLGIMPN